MLKVKLITAVLVLGLASAEANALIINIDATVSGCTTCSGGPTDPSVAAGTVVTLIHPVIITLGPGTYTIANAATVNGVESGANLGFVAWNYQAGNPNPWVWSFLVATDNGNGTGTMIKGEYVAGVFPTQAAVAGATGVVTGNYSTVLSSTSTAGFIDTLVLAQTTTLDFFTDDYFLPDNAGGVALKIVPEPSTLLLLVAGLVSLGVGRGRGRQSPS